MRVLWFGPGDFGSVWVFGWRDGFKVEVCARRRQNPDLTQRSYIHDREKVSRSCEETSDTPNVLILPSQKLN